MRSGVDPAANCRVFEELVRDAAGKGARYIQSPEMTGIVQKSRVALDAAIASERDDPLVKTAAALAAELEVHLHVGSTAIRTENGGIANRAFLFSRQGMLIATYDKIHMFDVDLDHGESWRESAVYTPGKQAVVAETPLASIGLAICYDLRFPHLFRDQAIAGASVLTLPAAFTRQTGKKHWHTLLRARAIENGAWVLAAAQGGIHEDGRETYGHSLVVDPTGKVTAELDHDEPGVLVTELDLAAAATARANIPNLKNGRDYALEVASETPAAARRVS